MNIIIQNKNTTNDPMIMGHWYVTTFSSDITVPCRTLHSYGTIGGRFGVTVESLDAYLCYFVIVLLIEIIYKYCFNTEFKGKCCCYVFDICVALVSVVGILF